MSDKNMARPITVNHEQIIALYNDGVHAKEIAKQIKCTPKYVNRITREIRDANASSNEKTTEATASAKLAELAHQDVECDTTADKITKMTEIYYQLRDKCNIIIEERDAAMRDVHDIEKLVQELSEANQVLRDELAAKDKKIERLEAKLAKDAPQGMFPQGTPSGTRSVPTLSSGESVAAVKGAAFAQHLFIIIDEFQERLEDQLRDYSEGTDGEEPVVPVNVLDRYVIMPLNKAMQHYRTERAHNDI